MPYNPKDPESGRRSIRLPGYDYTQPDAYFFTIVAHNREYLFGEVVEDEMVLSPFGEVLWILDVDNDGRGDAFLEPTLLSRDVPSDEPSHSAKIRTGNASPLHSGPPSGSIGAIVGNLKSITTRRINKMRRTPGAKVWQRNYYERIIRNERELNAIRQYILDNPQNWMEDQER